MVPDKGSRARPCLVCSSGSRTHRERAIADTTTKEFERSRYTWCTRRNS